MPRNLTPAAKRARLKRQQETEQERVARQDQDRLQTAEARTNETEEEHQVRLDQVRLRTEQTRKNETVEERHGEYHDQVDAKWIVIRGPLKVIIIRPAGGQHPGYIWCFYLILISKNIS
jgi:hypothetical protein